MKKKLLHKPPLRTWLIFSLIGGVLGTLNTCWYLLKPDYFMHITQNYDFAYAPYALASVSFFFFMFFIPALLSTAILFPLLYSRIKKQYERGDIKILRHILNGIKFGVAASFATAFFFLLMIVIYKHLKESANVLEFAMLVPLGTPLLGIAGILLFFPALVFSGWFFSKITSIAIKKEHRIERS